MFVLFLISPSEQSFHLCTSEKKLFYATLFKATLDHLKSCMQCGFGYTVENDLTTFVP